MPQPSPISPSPTAACPPAAPLRRQPRGFTLIELLVVIGIIALLAGILIPAVSHVRLVGYETSTTAEIHTLMGVIEQYHNTFNYYPGPIDNDHVVAGSKAGSMKKAPTGTENLTLGLMGGLSPTNSAGGFAVDAKYFFIPAQCGQGALNLNPAKVDRYPAFIDASTANLQPPRTGPWVAGGADQLAAYGNSTNLFKDTPIPEFLDRFPDPLPILYIRATIGATSANGQGGSPPPQYNTNELKPYNFPEPNTARTKSASGSNKNDPYLAAAAAGSVPTSLFDQYFQNPNQKPNPYAKDGYILISAGRDRIYMSLDDLNSFGSPK